MQKPAVSRAIIATGLTLVILLLAFASLLPFLNDGFYQGTDWTLEFVRVSDYSRSLSSGGMPVRWSSDLDAGYGSPIYNFFPPLYLLMISGLISAGAGIVTAAKAVLFALKALGIFGTYLLLRRDFGYAGALAGAGLFAFAPYHYHDIFGRSAFSEFTALSIAPLVFYGISAAARGKNHGLSSSVILTAALSAFVLAHNLSILMYGPLFALYAITLIASVRPVRGITVLVLSAAAAFIITSFYTMPVLMERGLVQLRWLTAGKLDVMENLMQLKSIFSFTASPSVTPFPVLIYALLLSMLAIRWNTLAAEVRNALVIVILSSAAYVFLVTPSSEAFWANTPGVKIMQFPSRLLSPVALLTAWAGGAVVLIVKTGRGRAAVASVLVMLSAASFYAKYTPGGGSYVNLTNDTFSSEMIRRFDLPATASNEYRPVWAKEQGGTYVRLDSDSLPEDMVIYGNKGGRVAPVEPLRPVGRLEAADQSAVVETLISRPGAHHFRVTSSVDTMLTARIFYYPGWTALVDSRAVPTDITDGGLISFPVGAGTHEVLIKFTETTSRKAADALSIAGAVFFLLALALASYRAIRKRP